MRKLVPLADRGPLRVVFVATDLRVGGAEILLAEIVRRMDRDRFAPEICCLKTPGELGEILAREVPLHHDLIRGKYNLAVLHRLRRLFRARRTDAVVTVGTGGDRMFWGRLGAWLAGVPVIASALHSTGLPQRVERMNRLLAPITDAFIGVAEAHGRYLAENEGCPAAKVRVVPNGVDLERFHPCWPDETLRASLKIPAGAPVVGIVAALRPEKNHALFLEAAAHVLREIPNAHFLIVGDGPERPRLEAHSAALGLQHAVHFLGSRSDVPRLLPLMRAFALTSHMEANPVSILEAMACEVPVIAPAVGSIPEVIDDGRNGLLVPPGDAAATATRLCGLLKNRGAAETIGRAARETVVARWSIDRMVGGYQDLLAGIYESKCKPAKRASSGNPISVPTANAPAGSSP